jgi:hypothetical protein
MISSVFSENEDGGPCCSECHKTFGEMDRQILDDLESDDILPDPENSFFTYLSKLNDGLEIQIDEDRHIVFFKIGERPIMTIYTDYKEFIDGFETNFPIVNLYGNSLDGSFTKFGMWIISYDSEMDKKIGKFWCKSNQLDEPDILF